MRLSERPRVALARAPTPLERLSRTSAALGAEIWVKRDDLTGLELSGNKVRKLELLCADALDRGADTLITCGGVNSNHARATAVAAARLGLGCHLVLRGEDRAPPAGNLLLDRLVGAGVTFITLAEWQHRDRLMAELAGKLEVEGKRPYVIPEGGSNALGSLGYARAVPELLEQAEASGLAVRRVVHAVGSGGTTAGLALGLAAAGRSDIDVLGVAVCDDAAYFDAKIAGILDEALARGDIDAELRAAARWRILEGHKGRGYALSTPEELADYVALARREGLFVDPVYTGKAYRGLLAEARAGCLEGITVFLHTGGMFELFAHGAELGAATR